MGVDSRRRRVGVGLGLLCSAWVLSAAVVAALHGALGVAAFAVLLAVLAVRLRRQ